MKQLKTLLTGASSIMFMTICVNAPTEAQEKAKGSLWNHNGSIVYLIADGQNRQFYYQKPRIGMFQVGVRPGDLLFSGTTHDGVYYGTAYMFNEKCGNAPYVVSGPIMDNSERVVLRGDAPRFGRNCKIIGQFKDTLEFTFLGESKAADHVPSPDRLAIPGINGVWKLLPDGSDDRRFTFSSDDGKITISAIDLSCQINDIKPEPGGSFSGHANCGEESSESYSIDTLRMLHVNNEVFLIETSVILRTKDASSTPAIEQVHHEEPANIRIYKKLQPD